jgi:hypothetical protein
MNTDLLAREFKTILADCGEQVTYTPQTGSPVTCNALVREDKTLGDGPNTMDHAYRSGLGRYATARVSGLDIPVPAYRETLTTSDGITWTIQQTERLWSSNGWKLYVSADERGGF